MTERQTETAAMYRENELFAERESVETTRAYCAHLSCIADIQGGNAGFDMVDSMMDYLTDERFSRAHVADAWPEFAAWKKADDARRASIRAESKRKVLL